MAQVLDVLEKDPTSARAQQQFQRELFAMRSYRLAVQPLRLTKALEERGALSPRYREAPPQLASHRGGPWRLPTRVLELDAVGLEKPPPPPIPVWRLEESIWAPRRRRADSRGYYDGDTARVAFEVDWAGASEGGSLARMILRNDRDEPDAWARRDLSEVDEVRSVLLEHAPLLYNVFDYYASCAGAGGSGGGSGDIFAISSAQYKLFVQECALVEQGTRSCNSTAFDQLFVALNASPGSGSGGGAMGGRGGGGTSFDNRHSLNRREFLTCLVHIAVMKFVAPGRMDDVSLAVEAVCAQLKEKAPLACRMDADAFRHAACYVEETDAVLRKYEAPLRSLFETYAAGDADKQDHNDVLRSMSDMGFDEYTRLIDDFRLVDDEFTQREATLCFVWSRLRVVDETLLRSRARLTQLGFEDFLEALVRLATMKATPLDSEVVKAGCEDGGEWLVAIRDADPLDYARFLAARATSFDDYLSIADARQPPWRSLEHIVTFLIRRAGGVPAGAGGGDKGGGAGRGAGGRSSPPPPAGGRSSPPAGGGGGGEEGGEDTRAALRRRGSTMLMASGLGQPPEQPVHSEHSEQPMAASEQEEASAEATLAAPESGAEADQAAPAGIADAPSPEGGVRPDTARPTAAEPVAVAAPTPPAAPELPTQPPAPPLALTREDVLLFRNSKAKPRF